MKLIPFLLLIAFSVTSCDKSEVNKPEQQGPLPITEAVKTGDWMVTYLENNAPMDIGMTFIKFNSAGTLVATQEGTNYNGTWTEKNTGGNNTLTINITTTSTSLKMVNRVWKAENISEYIIDLKDPAVGSKATVQLMKH
jgi:hypothetical protein